jgi:hypothetical protein
MQERGTVPMQSAAHAICRDYTCNKFGGRLEPFRNRVRIGYFKASLIFAA